MIETPPALRRACEAVEASEATMAYIMTGGRLPTGPGLRWRGYPPDLEEAFAEALDVGLPAAIRFGEILAVIDGFRAGSPLSGFVSAAQSTMVSAMSWFYAVARWVDLSGVPVSAIEQAVALVGGDPSEVVIRTLSEEFRVPQRQLGLGGFSDAVVRHGETLRRWWATASREQQGVVIERAWRLDDTGLAQIADEIATAAAEHSRAERALLDPPPYLRTDGAPSLSARLGDVRWRVWREMATTGGATTRRRALGLLWSEGDEETRAWARATALADTAASVRALPDLWEPDRAQVLDGRGAVEQAARAVLPKGLPSGLRWVLEAGLPTLRWADGTPVEDVVWQSWVHQGVRAKQVKPNAALRAVAAELDQRSAHAFAQALLEGWIAQDLRPRSAVEIAELAQAEAAARFQAHQTNPAYAQWDPLFGRPEEEILASVTAHLSRQPVGTASASRGLLAVVAALGGPGVAGPVGRYLNSWAGRTTQAKALVALLAQIDDAAALQLLVALPGRLRTSGLAAESRRQVGELAERMGLTVDELADRAVPDAGLDANGELSVSYGQRSFVVRLNDDLSWTVRDESGKTLRSLPPPRVSDDAEAVAAAKAAVATARSVVKDVVKLQTPRLRDHMATQKTWTVQEWVQQIGEHPVMSRLGRRLVWTVEPGGPFRPLDDGTLSDVDDETVVLAPEGRVRLAHSATLAPDLRAAWREHLADYEVVSLFDQLSTDPVDVDPRSTELTDHRGWVLDAFGLRGQTMRRGYRRGEPGNAGVFTTYVKDYPAVATTVVIGFSGSYLPEQARPVALTGLYFLRGERRLTVSEVMPTLLAESMADLAGIAASGSGFDPQWQTKTRL